MANTANLYLSCLRYLSILLHLYSPNKHIERDSPTQLTWRGCIPGRSTKCSWIPPGPWPPCTSVFWMPVVKWIPRATRWRHYLYRAHSNNLWNCRGWLFMAAQLSLMDGGVLFHSCAAVVAVPLWWHFKHFSKNIAIRDVERHADGQVAMIMQSQWVVRHCKTILVQFYMFVVWVYIVPVDQLQKNCRKY